MEPAMSSREIAELTNSRHDSVKRSMERMASSLVISITPTVEPTAGGGKPITIYHVTKRDSYVVVAQLSPEFTARLVDRWQELEEANQFKIPQTLPEALLLAAELAKQNEEAQRQLAIAAPKAEFAVHIAICR
ncbi:Rha family transcriptional regulator [Vibrio fluvialis]|nr:Rha family transcriptional regulator [Vibrio fluvialis]